MANAASVDSMRVLKAAEVRAGVSLACVLLLGGCAQINSKVEYTGLGVADPASDDQIAQDYKQRIHREPKEVQDVVVLVDTLPEGFKYDDGVLSVADGFDHDVIGKFRFRMGTASFYFLAWFLDYEDGWRKGLCYPQVPLEWVSMGIWSAVPSSYPCHPGPRTKAGLVGEAKVLAAAAGGDGVIMGYNSVKQAKALGAEGFIVVLDPEVRGKDMKTEPMKLTEGEDDGS